MANKKDGTPRASTTGGPGPRVVDMSNWRRRLQESRLKFDDRAKNIFLEKYAECGLMYVSARAAGVTPPTVTSHVENDPDFAAAFQDAKDAYRDRVMAHAYKLSIEGVEEPIIGGKDKDEVVAYKKVYATNILAMEMRRVNPDYKDRADVNLSGNVGGVLVVPARLSVEEWTKAAAEYRDQMPGEGKDGGSSGTKG
ncbi:MAG TPA: hypothetical protein PKN52_00045 [Trueperaceae bacterium]|nr:hypothetical protein [Trueperaceae bacterium]